MEARAKARLIEEQAAYQEKLAARQIKEQEWTLMTTSYNLKRLFNLEIKRA